MTSEQITELRSKLNHAVIRENKEISGEDLTTVVEIMKSFAGQIDWQFKWSHWGFCYLYLHFGNLNAEVHPLMKLRRVDEAIGWFMGKRNFEILTFREKAIKIILNKQVKLLITLITNNNYIFPDSICRVHM